jgi:hypothetical protein
VRVELGEDRAQHGDRLRRLLESITQQQRALEQQIAAFLAIARLHREPAGELGELLRIIQAQRLIAQVAQRLGVLDEVEQLAVRLGRRHLVAERTGEQPRAAPVELGLGAGVLGTLGLIAQHRNQVVVAAGGLVQRDQVVGLAALERDAREQRLGARVAGVGQEHEPAPCAVGVAHAIEGQFRCGEQRVGAARAGVDLADGVELGEQLVVTAGRAEQRDQLPARLELERGRVRPRAQRGDRALAIAETELEQPREPARGLGLALRVALAPQHLLERPRQRALIRDRLARLDQLVERRFEVGIELLDHLAQYERGFRRFVQARAQQVTVLVQQVAFLAAVLLERREPVQAVAEQLGVVALQRLRAHEAQRLHVFFERQQLRPRGLGAGVVVERSCQRARHAPQQRRAYARVRLGADALAQPQHQRVVAADTLEHRVQLVEPLAQYGEREQRAIGPGMAFGEQRREAAERAVAVAQLCARELGRGERRLDLRLALVLEPAQRVERRKQLRLALRRREQRSQAALRLGVGRGGLRPQPERGDRARTVAQLALAHAGEPRRELGALSRVFAAREHALERERERGEVARGLAGAHELVIGGLVVRIALQ